LVILTPTGLRTGLDALRAAASDDNAAQLIFPKRIDYREMEL
jgi:hypothetical protein